MSVLSNLTGTHVLVYFSVANIQWRIQDLWNGGGDGEWPKATRGYGVGRGVPSPLGWGLGRGCTAPQKKI